MRDSKAWISGCSGYALTPDEIAFFADERPWGFILFARNIGDPGQLTDLVASLKEIGGRETVPVFIDQEGGRVQRLRPPFAPRFPPSAAIGALHPRSPERAKRAAWLQGRLLAADLAVYGINANCIPCLDVPVPGSHSVIGDRAYSNDPSVVSVLGRAVADGVLAGGALPVMKHMPGHGRGDADSHLELPRVTADRNDLAAHDFIPFKALHDLPAGMTAHLMFEALDPLWPATLSPTIISDVVRGHIGFDGLLLTDDLSMKALRGDFATLSSQALEAGCDIVLHCNGDMEEMRAVARGVPTLGGRSLERANSALQSIAAGSTAEDIDALRAEFFDLIGRVS